MLRDTMKQLEEFQALAKQHGEKSMALMSNPCHA